MIDEELSQQYALQRKTDFAGLARSPGAWYHHAQSLRHAADVLYIEHQKGLEGLIENSKELAHIEPGSEQFVRLMVRNLENFADWRLIETYKLLMGFSFENLLKGIALAKNPSILQVDKLVGIKSHNLSGIANYHKIGISPEESKLLDLLSTYIEWEGRYPVPLEEADMYPFEKSQGIFVPRGHGLDEGEIREQLNPFWDRLSFDLLSQKPAP